MNDSVSPQQNPQSLVNAVPVEDMQMNEDGTFDLHDPNLYLNRELTWLAFNKRVLEKAQDPDVPLLERVKFIAILSSNLDEFFMKRIGGLKQQVGAGVTTTSVDGRTPLQQIQESYAVVRDLEEQKRNIFSALQQDLDAHDIRICPYELLSQEDKEFVRDYYLQNIFPLVTPQSVDPAHPFPFISNFSINLLVTLKYPDGDESMLARVKVPVGSGISRFIKLNDHMHYVLLEDVMSNNLDLLFPKMVIENCDYFRVVRNINVGSSRAKADDLLASIESEVRNRKFATVVRLTVNAEMDPVRQGMLAAELKLQSADDVFAVEGMLSMRDLWTIALLNVPELRDAPHRPIEHVKLKGQPNIFHVIREHGSLFLHHPYESFASSVVRFLKEASEDPKVLAIKMTLYRTSQDTKIIDYLINAASNGKQVAVAVELQARFDEAANILWASRMEEAGIHVTYGVLGLKTHSKVILVIRKDYSGLRRYSHIGTGNYHAGTARLYSDVGILTCDEEIGKDLTELYNFLTTGYTPKRNYLKLLPAPKIMKEALISKIQREAKHQQASGNGLLRLKMNALEDIDICRELYAASQAGVKIDLIVRDTCRVRPGINNLSETIKVISIVDKFLEHSRIYYFHNDGNEEYYIGSADLMSRNLEHRVEVLVPVEADTHKEECEKILDACLKDNLSSWSMQPDGTYFRKTFQDEEQISAQGKMEELAQLRKKSAQSHKKVKKNKYKII